MVNDDDAVMLENRDEECRMLRERCAALERQLAEERAGAEAALTAALRIVFAAGEESARIQLGLPVQRQPQSRRRGHLRSLSAVIVFAMLGAVVLNAVAHMRAHAPQHPYAAALEAGGGPAPGLGKPPARPL